MFQISIKRPELVVWSLSQTVVQGGCTCPQWGIDNAHVSGGKPCPACWTGCPGIRIYCTVSVTSGICGGHIHVVLAMAAKLRTNVLHICYECQCTCIFWSIFGILNVVHVYIPSIYNYPGSSYLFYTGFEIKLSYSSFFCRLHCVQWSLLSEECANSGAVVLTTL